MLHHVLSFEFTEALKFKLSKQNVALIDINLVSNPLRLQVMNLLKGHKLNVNSQQTWNGVGKPPAAEVLVSDSREW